MNLKENASLAALLRNILAASTLSLGACESLLFSDHVGCKDCDPGVAVEGTGGRIVRPIPEGPWVPLIAACMERGGSRSECIEELPPDLRTELNERVSEGSSGG